jgi:integrase
MDVHGYAKRVEYALRDLEREGFPEEDKRLVREFAEHLRARNLNLGRIAKYIFGLIVLRRQMKCSFRDLDRKEIERLVAWINSSDYTPQTKMGMKGILKRFYKWLKYGSTDKDVPYPPEVAWIKENVKKHERRKPEILTEDEVRCMIEAASCIRDKAFIAVAYEAGFRIGEMLNIRLGDVAFDEYGARIRVHGKTGERIVRLITSAPLLAKYLEDHPKRDDPEWPLWIHYGVRNRHGPLSYTAVRKMLKGVAKRAGIRKRIYPHMFRHSAATRDAKFLTEAELKVKYGWDMASRMAAVYVHLAGKDIDDKLLAVYSGRKLEPPKPEFRPIICPKCGEKNTPGQRYCGKCGTPLNPEEIAKAGIEYEALKKELEEVKALLRSLLKD